MADLTLKRARTCLLPLLVLLFVGALSTQRAHAGTGTFKDGKFNFCVSVRFNATEAELQKIRAAFARAGQILADATDGQHQFGNVSIINNSGAGDQAEFWINRTVAGSIAHATPGKYGYRHTHVNMFYPSNFGQFTEFSALTIIHEFGHHAYNLGDEYSTLNGAPGTAECAPRGADGPTLNYCLMDVLTRGGTLGNYNINEFCVASNHDPNQNTAQHALHHESCWETMWKLPRAWRLRPFEGLPQSPAPASQQANLLTACAGQTQRVAILIDRSGSMLDVDPAFDRAGSRLTIAQRAAKTFVNRVNRDNTPGTFVAGVSFSASSSVDFALAEMNNDTARAGAMAALDTLQAGGPTNIGEGLLTAMAQIQSQGECPDCEKSIVLISDGDHNFGIPPESVIPELQRAGIKVVTVALGKSISVSGEAALKNLAIGTGGFYTRVYVPDHLIHFMIEYSEYFSGYLPGAEYRINVQTSGRREAPVYVEPGAASATFSMSFADPGDNLTFSLLKPTGEAVTASNGSTIELITDTASRTFKVTNPSQGTWKMVVSAGTVVTGRVNLLAQLRHEGAGLFAWVENDGVTYSTEPVRLHALSTYDGRNVVASSVTGSVTRPDGSEMPVTLFDDGLAEHGDAVSNDGVYSALFNQYNADGAYTFNLIAKNTTGLFYGGEPLVDENGVQQNPAPGPSVPPFDRTARATAIVAGLANGDTVWVDDAIPQGATTQGEWYWVNANPAPVMGGAAHQSKITELSPYTHDEHSFVGATSKLPVGAGDTLFAYVFLDPNISPKQIMLQWHTDDGWEHRAYWGDSYIQLGVEGTNSRRFMGPLPAAGRWVRLEVPAASVGLEGKVLDGMAFSTNGNRATWDRAGRARGATTPTPGPADFVWFDDGRPAGSVEENTDDVWDWVNIPGPYSGQLCHRSFLRGDTGAGRLRTHGFRQAQTPMKVEPGDVLYTYAYVDPNHRPDEIIVQWNDGDGWEHRAYWGNNFVNLGVTGTESRRFMGGIPPSAQWVRLEVPASYVGLEGKSVYGMSFGYYKQNDRARVSWDLAGKTSQPQTIPYPLTSLTPLWRFRADSYGYSYSTNDIGRAEQTIQGIRAYVHSNQAAGTVPFYRFRDHSNQRYYYGISKTPPDSGWTFDGVEFYIYPGQVPGTVPFHQFFYMKNGRPGYFYTTDPAEGSGLGFTPLGVAGYLHASNPLAPVAPSDSYITSPNGMYWSDNSSNESGFEIEYLDGANGWQWVGNVGPNVTSFSHIYMKICEARFRVRAYNGVGHSAYSTAQAGTSFGGKCIYAWPQTNGSPPSVSLLSPADGATFKAGANVQLKAEAFDAQGPGTIARVEFFDGGYKIGESTQPPYMATLSGLTAGTHSLTATATDTSARSATSPPVAITAQPVGAGDLIISEFRFRGVGGQLDEFVELYNNTDFNVTVSTTDGSGGWSLVGSDGSVRFTIPNGTLIPARGHYLAVNAGAYSLGAHAQADTQWLGDIADGAGVALFRSSAPSNFTNEYRLDAAGFGSVADARFREGAGLQPAAGVSANSEFTFFRRLNGGTPRDTNDNAADFLFVSTDAVASGGVQSSLGAPGPENLAAPVQRNSWFGFTVLDPAVNSSTPPNRVRDFTSDPANNSTFGTLAMRRTVINNTGAPITRLRFRITDVTTYPVPSGTADVRVRSSGTVQVTRTDGSVVTVQGTTLQTPPAQPNGGGFNSALAVGTITLSEPLQPGASVHVQFLLGLQSNGSFRFFFNIEALQ